MSDTVKPIRQQMFLSEDLADEGLSLLDSIGDNVYRVQAKQDDPERGVKAGDIKTLDLNKLFAAKGKRADEFDIVANTPDSASDVSPVGLLDRFKTNFGDARGNINYMKKRFEDASFNAEGQLVVKDKGVWHAVDPRGMGNGDGWDVAEAIADTLDLADEAIVGGASALGGILGTAASPAGTVGGAALGAAAGKSVNTIIGRIMGTYAGTPEETVRDIGTEALMAMAGTTVALGAQKAIVPALKKTFSVLSENIPEGGKAAINVMLQKLSGLRPESANRVLDQAALRGEQGVLQQMDEVLTAGRAAGKGRVVADDEFASIAMKGAVDKLKEGGLNAQKALSHIFKQKEASLIAEHGDEFAANIRRPIESALADLGSLGIIDPIKNASGAVTGYKPVASKVLAEKLGFQASAEADVVGRELNKWLMGANQAFKGSGEISGKQGLKSVIDMRRGFDDLYYSYIAGNPALENIFAGTTSKLREQLTSSIKGKAAEPFAAMNNFYKENIQVVKEVGKMARAESSATGDAFTKRLLSSGDDFVSTKAGIKKISELLEQVPSLKPKGLRTNLNDYVLNRLAATDAVRMMPKGSSGIGQSGLAFVSPRTATQGVRLGMFVGDAAKKVGVKPMMAFANTLKGMGAGKALDFASRPELMGPALGQILEASQTDGAANDLVRQLIRRQGQ